MMLHRAPPPRDAPPRASPSCSSPSTTGRGRGSGGHVASLAGKRDGVARLYGEVGLGSHKPDSVVVALLWTHSEDLGEGFHGLGSVTDISFVLDAANAVPEAGGVHYGTRQSLSSHGTAAPTRGGRWFRFIDDLGACDEA